MARRREKRGSAREQDRRNARLIVVLFVVLVVCAAFVAGFVLRGNEALLARLGLDSASRDPASNPGLTVSGSTADSLSARIAEVQGVLAQQSLDDYNLDDATNTLLAALAEATDDSYLRYYDAEHYATYLKEVSATYAGVGILFGERAGEAYVVDVFSGSEADSKGVLAGDYVVAIGDDLGNDGWTAAEVVKSVTREEGEKVNITFRHPEAEGAEGGSEYTVSLTCVKDQAPNVTTELSGTVGYVKLAQVTQNADELVEQAVEELTAQGALAFVLDLRDNPGGYLTQSIDVASLFVRSGVIVGIQGKEGTNTRSATLHTATDAPVVLLVNGNTAGTAEVIAAALAANGSTVVGERTMGKGSVQSIQELSFGGALRYTSALYLTPEGHPINGVGVAPDVSVPSPASEDEADIQLARALEVAAELAPVQEAAPAAGAEGEAGAAEAEGAGAAGEAAGEAAATDAAQEAGAATSGQAGA